MLKSSRTLVVLGSFMLLAGVLASSPDMAHANRGQCAQPFTNGGEPSASDCLFILQTAVGNHACDNPCICAPKGTLPVRATDALVCLVRSVNPGATISCPCADLRDAAYAFNPATDVTNANVRPRYVATDYIGAFPQGQSPVTGDWTNDWTIELHGNHTNWEPSLHGTLNGAVPSANGACPTGTTDIGNTNLPGGFAGSMDICQLNARYAVNGSTINLTNDNIYRLGGAANQGTIIGNGDAIGSTFAGVVHVTLNIEPGTAILGDLHEALAISRGSKINVNGLVDSPVVMTSVTQFNSWLAGGDGTSGTQEWGGLVLAGFGASNSCNNGTTCDGLGEGFINPFAFGGIGANLHDDDDSGSLHYLTVRNAGFDLDGNGSELNGVTFYTVGYNTDCDHVQVHRNFDDNFEWFGGQVFCDHLVGTGGNDDNIDTDNGWQGGVQFALMQQYDGLGDNGFESDNDAAGDLNLPTTKPTVVNLTHLGTINAGTVSGYAHRGMRIRRQSGYFAWNGITQKSGKSCILLESVLANRAGSLTNADDGELQIHNYDAYCPNQGNVGFVGTFESTGSDSAANIQTWYQADPNNRTVDPTLSATGYPGDPGNN